MKSLGDIFDDTGVPIHFEQYLRARGIATLPLLARAASTEDDLRKRVIIPFVNGYEIDGTTYEAVGVDTLALEASIVVAWEMAQIEHHRYLQFMSDFDYAPSRSADSCEDSRSRQRSNKDLKGVFPEREDEENSQGEARGEAREQQKREEIEKDHDAINGEDGEEAVSEVNSLPTFSPGEPLKVRCEPSAAWRHPARDATGGKVASSIQPQVENAGVRMHCTYWTPRHPSRQESQPILQTTSVNEPIRSNSCSRLGSHQPNNLSVAVNGMPYTARRCDHNGVRKDMYIRSASTQSRLPGTSTPQPQPPNLVSPQLRSRSVTPAGSPQLQSRVVQPQLQSRAVYPSSHTHFTTSAVTRTNQPRLMPSLNCKGQEKGKGKRRDEEMDGKVARNENVITSQPQVGIDPFEKFTMEELKCSPKCSPRITDVSVARLSSESTPDMNDMGKFSTKSEMQDIIRRAGMVDSHVCGQAPSKQLNVQQNNVFGLQSFTRRPLNQLRVISSPQPQPQPKHAASPKLGSRSVRNISSPQIQSPSHVHSFHQIVSSPLRHPKTQVRLHTG